MIMTKYDKKSLSVLPVLLTLLTTIFNSSVIALLVNFWFLLEKETPKTRIW